MRKSGYNFPINSIRCNLLPSLKKHKAVRYKANIMNLCESFLRQRALLALSSLGIIALLGMSACGGGGGGGSSDSGQNPDPVTVDLSPPRLTPVPS
jgi:hypothetical protein